MDGKDSWFFSSSYKRMLCKSCATPFVLSGFVGVVPCAPPSLGTKVSLLTFNKMSSILKIRIYTFTIGASFNVS